MTSRKSSDVSAPMLEPTRTATNKPLAAPAIASPMRSSTWANFRTRDRIVVPTECDDIRLGHFSAAWKALPKRADGWKLAFHQQTALRAEVEQRASPRHGRT